jgi:diketogulonate reductase-like aldo/keto reductase
VKQRRLGGSDERISVIGQGTWNVAVRGRAGERAVAALGLGIDLGLAHIDTAEMYGDGAVERLVGRAIAGRRGEVFLATKVLPQHASFAGTVRACEASLARLGVERADLYMIHWPGRHPIAETMAALEHLVDAGKVRYIGVSNFDVGELREAQRAVRKHPIVADQVLYHLGDRGIENRLLPYCVRERITIVAYSPFGSGEFPHPASAGGRVLSGIAARRGITPHQVALAFLTRDPCVVAIPKATSPEHVRENAAAADVRLTAGEIAAIDRAFPRPPERTALGMI